MLQDLRSFFELPTVLNTFQYYDVMWGPDVAVTNDQQFCYFSDCQIYPESFLGSLYNS